MNDFFKFPRTPHLSWLADGAPRDDKVMSAVERSQFLANPIVVEEKVDGANIGLSLGGGGDVRVQSRGGYLGPGSHPQFQPLWGWIAERAHRLKDALRGGLILFGEWCFAVHSVRYSELPDWFLGFDVYDPSQGRFFSTARRNRLLSSVQVTPVPQISRGRFDANMLVEVLHTRRSALGAQTLEGLYLRNESDDWLNARAKLVRADFLQGIEEHWSRRRIEPNRLAEPDRSRRT